MNEDNGGQAFPTMSNTEYIPGMTLRDWFAGQALVGELSAGVLPMSDKEMKAHASMYYKIADAIIAERNNE